MFRFLNLCNCAVIVVAGFYIAGHLDVQASIDHEVSQAQADLSQAQLSYLRAHTESMADAGKHYCDALRSLSAAESKIHRAKMIAMNNRIDVQVNRSFNKTNAFTGYFARKVKCEMEQYYRRGKPQVDPILAKGFNSL